MTLLFLNKFRIKDLKKRVKHLLGIFLIFFLISFAYMAFHSSKYDIYLNRYHHTILPQEKFMEIRPVVYGQPSEDLYRGHFAGQIYYTGMESALLYSKEYILFIKFLPEKSSVIPHWNLRFVDIPY